MSMVLVRNAKLEVDKVYKNKNGGIYKCLTSNLNGALMRNVHTGWTLYANVITLYEDDTIEWDYSTGGRFHKNLENTYSY